jgi:hypothetical protein
MITDWVIKDLVLDPDSNKLMDIEVPDDLLIVVVPGLSPLGEAAN